LNVKRSLKFKQEKQYKNHSKLTFFNLKAVAVSNNQSNNIPYIVLEDCLKIPTENSTFLQYTIVICPSFVIAI